MYYSKCIYHYSSIFRDGVAFVKKKNEEGGIPGARMTDPEVLPSQNPKETRPPTFRESESLSCRDLRRPTRKSVVLSWRLGRGKRGPRRPLRKRRITHESPGPNPTRIINPGPRWIRQQKSWEKLVVPLLRSRVVHFCGRGAWQVICSRERGPDWHLFASTARRSAPWIHPGKTGPSDGKKGTRPIEYNKNRNFPPTPPRLL